jgi:hypothetical protein
MGKMTLDLDDRSARLIHGTDVWSEMADLLSAYSDIQAAITSVGPDADQFLPLRGPACIVVNAGAAAMQDGTTDPEVLLGWTRRGVRVYSLPTLQATVILAQGMRSFVMVGSAVAARASIPRLGQAMLVADEPETVEEVRQAIEEWKQQAGQPLTDEWLQSAVQRHRPAVAAPVERLVERLPDRRPAPPVGYRPAVPPPTPAISAQPTAALEPTRMDPALTPAAVTESGTTMNPVGAPAPAPAGAAAAPVAPATAPTPAPQNWASDDDDELGEVGPVVWPKPKYIYLAPLSREGRASLSALERLRHLKGEHRVRSEHDGSPVLEVEMFWRDEPAKTPAKPSVTYREGWHLVPIQMMGTVRPTTTSQLTAPGRVLQSYTDYSAHPARTYYYLLTHTGGHSMTFRVLRDMLAGLGERASFDHAYMMQHKVDAILELWPEIPYAD